MSGKIIWFVAILFAALGAVLLVVGTLQVPLLTLVGLPFVLLGWLLLGLLFFGESIRRTDPQRHPQWMWWVSLIGGVAGVAAFALPSLFALPIILILGQRQHLLLGLLFTLLGLLASLGTVALVLYALRHRPEPTAYEEPPESEWETEAYHAWVQGGVGNPARQDGGHDDA